MDLNEIKKHWERWASFGVDLRATTKTTTIKFLEVDALARAVRRAGLIRGDVLEAGCGNGHNCVSLARELPDFRFDGFDYIQEMIDGAEALTRGEGLQDRVRYFVGDVLETPNMTNLRDEYDVVFCDRLVINLNTEALQQDAIRSLAARVRPGGMFLCLENFSETYSRQNDARRWLGLSPRQSADYNRFIDGDRMVTFATSLGLELLDVDDFGSLHDLLLYVLIPATNDGVIEYDHPLVAAAATLSAEASARRMNNFGDFGQNRLFSFRRRS